MGKPERVEGEVEKGNPWAVMGENPLLGGPCHRRQECFRHLSNQSQITPLDHFALVLDV